jgi:hypothetical protein
MKMMVLAQEAGAVLYTEVKRKTLDESFNKLHLLNLTNAPLLVTEVGFKTGQEELGDFMAPVWRIVNPGEGIEVFDSHKYREWDQDVEENVRPFEDLMHPKAELPPLTFMLKFLVAAGERTVSFAAKGIRREDTLELQLQEQ